MNYMLTNDGIELLAKVNAGMALHLTKAESGSGYSSIPFTLPTVVDKKQTLQIDSVNAEAGIAVINCVLSNLELEAEYSLRQIGIYAMDSDLQKEILFIIGQQFNGDPIPSITEMEVEYTYIIGQKISNTSDIKIDIGANDFVRKQLFYDHVNNQFNPHKTTKAQIGLDMVDNTADINKPISTATQVALDAAYANGNAYTDVKIASLINGAPETLDTLKEVANAIESNKTVVEALDAAIGTKANKVEVDAHMANTTVHITKTERDKWNAKQNAMTVDTTLSATSTNPIQNKAVKTAFDQQTSQNINFTNSLSTLNQSLTTIDLKLQNKFAIVHGVSPSALNILVIHPYPTGFNVSNTLILSLNVADSAPGGSGAWAVVRENGIGIQVSYSPYLNAPFKLALIREDI